ncbi:hypothetical protein LSTR_LSTR004657 [Laodelphax striatellus]|uniref:Uncharacterized protein n=1 Tax=Laodelphax striatellus TaxID=195883 RepID=A0A482WTN9_LAOST|nr:hypothetical protein LSTR_LSTR004657 [Laodelphax striatellus]
MEFQNLIMLSREDPPLASYKERIRAVLQQIILEQRLEAERPLFQTYSNLLDMSTAHSEFTRSISEYEGSLTESQINSIKMSCFQGSDIFYSGSCQTATSIHDDS